MERPPLMKSVNILTLALISLLSFGKALTMEKSLESSSESVSLEFYDHSSSDEQEETKSDDIIPSLLQEIQQLSKGNVGKALITIFKEIISEPLGEQGVLSEIFKEIVSGPLGEQEDEAFRSKFITKILKFVTALLKNYPTVLETTVPFQKTLGTKTWLAALTTALLINDTLEVRAQLFETAVPYFQKDFSAEEIEVLFFEVSKIPLAERPGILKLAQVFLQESGTAEEILGTIHILRKTSTTTDDRAAAFALSQSFIKEAHSTKEKMYNVITFREVCLIPTTAERTEVLKIAADLLQGSGNAWLRGETIHLLRKISTTDRSAVLTTAQPLLREAASGEEKFRIIASISQVSPLDREGVLKLISPLLAKAKSAEEKCRLIELIGKTLEAERETMFKYCFMLIDDVTDSKARALIIVTLSSIGTSRLAEIFPALRAISPAVRGDVFAAAARLFIHCTTEWTMIIQAVSTITEKELDSVIAFTQWCLEAGGASTARCISLINTLRDMPTTERQQLHRLVKGYLERQKKYCQYAIEHFFLTKERAWISTMLINIPAVDRGALFESLDAIHKDVSQYLEEQERRCERELEYFSPSDKSDERIWICTILITTP